MVLTRSATAAAAANDDAFWVGDGPVGGGREDGQVTMMKRKREELEIEEMELNITEKRARIEAQTIENQIRVDMHVHANNSEAKLAVIRSIVNTICVINSSTALDASTRLALMDMIRKYIHAMHSSDRA